MRTLQPLTAGALALLVACTVAPAFAQQDDTAGSEESARSDDRPSDRRGDDDRNWRDWREMMREWGGPGMMGGWWGGPRMMDPDEYGDHGGYGMPRGHHHWGSGWNRRGQGMHGGMPFMMMAMIDEDGSGTISHEEVERFHRRMFDYVDEDGDGELTPEEIGSMMGWRSGGRR